MFKIHYFTNKKLETCSLVTCDPCVFSVNWKTGRVFMAWYDDMDLINTAEGNI